ncbi:MAG: hypothetical protein INR71_14980 [Terriglobus roseus]|nr:hypothetical protein [Terriglobus roseus]
MGARRDGLFSGVCAVSASAILAGKIRSFVWSGVFQLLRVVPEFELILTVTFVESFRSSMRRDQVGLPVNTG